jgi:hypothetical protein
MSSTGRVDEGVVTQDDNTIDDGNDSLDAMGTGRTGSHLLGGMVYP